MLTSRASTPIRQGRGGRLRKGGRSVASDQGHPQAAHSVFHSPSIGIFRRPRYAPETADFPLARFFLRRLSTRRIFVPLLLPANSSLSISFRAPSFCSVSSEPKGQTPLPETSFRSHVVLVLPLALACAALQQKKDYKPRTSLHGLGRAGVAGRSCMLVPCKKLATWNSTVTSFSTSSHFAIAARSLILSISECPFSRHLGLLTCKQD